MENNSFQIEGVIHLIGERENKTGSFTTRDLVLMLDGRYPEYPRLQFTQDRADLLDKYSIGEQVRVHFDLRGREWQGKYFTNLNGWRIEKVGAEPAPTVTAQDEQGEQANIGAEDEGKLPF
jgi:single-strand DNA-binding protein